MKKWIFDGLWFVIAALVVSMITVTDAESIGNDQGTPENGVANVVVLFDTAKTNVKGEELDGMKRIADIMTRDSQATAVIEGYTDNSGKKSANLKLSKLRAENVKKHLVEKLKIEASRLKTMGYGQSKPIVSNATAEGRQKNRRVVVVIKAVEGARLSPGTVPVTAEKAVADVEVTGLMINAFDTMARAAINPVIYSESGQVIYGISVNEVNGSYSDCSIKEGLVKYSRDLSDAQKRYPSITSNPVMVKAIKVVGEGYRNIVIGDVDAKKIMELENKFHFLQNCKVIIVLDPIKQRQ
jgi:hypothetical protein